MKLKSESKVDQSSPTLGALMDYSLPGSSIHGIFQAKYWSAVPLPSDVKTIKDCISILLKGVHNYLENLDL